VSDQPSCCHCGATDDLMRFAGYVCRRPGCSPFAIYVCNDDIGCKVRQLQAKAERMQQDRRREW
jgi:hypothetical protein